MIDPISLGVGAGLVCLGMFIGFLVGASAARRPGSSRVLPICACEHPVGAHAEGGCEAEVERPFYAENGAWGGHEYVACACRRYTGPEPLSSDIWVPPMLPTTEADR